VVLLLFCYTLAFGFLMATCYVDRLKKYYTLAKLVNSTGFIVAAIWGKSLTGNTSLYNSLLPAFVLCLCGDVLLGLSDAKKSDKLFLAGLFSFLIGHITFIVAFNAIVPLSIYDFIFPAAVVILTALLTKMDGMELKSMKGYALVYSFFVAMLFSKAVSLVLIQGLSTRNILLCSGSLLFLISDTIILFLYFYVKKHHLVKFFNLFTYYYGMLLIALSVRY
jgi:uncharacterized membrane protein YhhN